MAIPISSDAFRMSIWDPLNGEWRAFEPAAEPMLQVTTTSPLRHDVRPIASKAVGIIFDDFIATFRWRPKRGAQWRVFCEWRPAGMSQSHWRKMRRERGLNRSIDVKVLP